MTNHTEDIDEQALRVEICNLLVEAFELSESEAQWFVNVLVLIRDNPDMWENFKMAAFEFFAQGSLFASIIQETWLRNDDE